ncbi:methyltransferase domain-containing protein [Candidatus Micrarchaeota archaeon]|nr:methyltransferase domain-containing protein [Candidatus Micrarchaeota archaeon]
MEISLDRKIGKYFTFEPSKSTPIYNWFYYKEAYSPECVHWALDKFKIKKGTILDPFCGIGTTLLSSKSAGLSAFGLDASPLAVFVSKTKTANYSKHDLEDIQSVLSLLFQTKIPPRFRWQFELFPIQKAFPPANLRDILMIREKLLLVENEKARNLLLLALISVLPMCSFVMKDGGVLRIKKKSVAPAKEMFKKRAKKMLKEITSSKINDPEPEVLLGDARAIPYEAESFDTLITSPPYLNNIDYTKVYGLELSLLELDWKAAERTRKQSLRSFITSQSKEEKIPEEAFDFAAKIPVAGTYFSDMEKVLSETHRVLKPNSSACFIVGNAVIHETHIPVDEILASIGERLGFESEIVVGLERIADVKPRKIKTRESAIIFHKK